MYKYNKGQDAINKTWFSGLAPLLIPNQQSSGRYIKTNYHNLFIDTDHFAPDRAREITDHLNNRASLPVGNSSQFSNEDLPTDYLAFYSYVSGKSLEDIVEMLGGGIRTNMEPPHCGGYMPDCPHQNKQFKPKVKVKTMFSPSIRIGPINIQFPPREQIKWQNIPWPHELTMINGAPLIAIKQGWSVRRCAITVHLIDFWGCS